MSGEALRKPLSDIIHSWAGLEGKWTEHRIVPMNVGDEFELRNGLIARAFATRHTVPSIGFSLIDRREKLLAAERICWRLARKSAGAYSPQDEGERPADYLHAGCAAGGVYG